MYLSQEAIGEKLYESEGKRGDLERGEVKEINSRGVNSPCKCRPEAPGVIFFRGDKINRISDVSEILSGDSDSWQGVQGLNLNL